MVPGRFSRDVLGWPVEVVRIVFGDGLDQSIGIVPGVLVGAFVHTGDMSLLVYKLCSAWGKGGLLRNPVGDAVLHVFLLGDFAVLYEGVKPSLNRPPGRVREGVNEV